MQHLPLDVRVPMDEDNVAIVRHEEKCIKCGMCKSVCEEYIGVHGTYTLEQTGGKGICIHCGQCTQVCPVDRNRVAGNIDHIHEDGGAHGNL